MSRSSDEDTSESNSPQKRQRDQHVPIGQDDGGEKGEGRKQETGPVGFWNPALKQVRLDVIKHWLLTSTSFVLQTRLGDILVVILTQFSSRDPLNLHPGNPLAVLGCSISSGAEPVSSCCIRCGFRWPGCSIYRYHAHRRSPNRLGSRIVDCTQWLVRLGISSSFSLQQ